MALTKVPSNLDAAVSVTQSQSDNSTNVATTAYVDTAISNLSDSAPAALNTLNEIAAALGDDANYAATTTAAIAAKLPLAGGAMTGVLTSSSHVQIAGNLDVVGQIGAYDNPGSAWGKMILRATDLEYKNSGGTIKVVIDTSGNVGIGTDAPTSKLDVNSTAYVNTDSTQAFRFTYNGSPRAMISAYGGEGELSLYRSSNAKNIYISSYYDSYFNGGNVGIGTAAPTGYRLVVENTSEDLLKLHNSTDGLDSLISFTNPGGTLGRVQGIDNGGLGFDVGNNAGGIISNAMSIDNTGNVGIGTASPAAKLHTYHSTNASDTLVFVDNLQTSQTGTDYNKYGIVGQTRGADASWSRGVGVSGLGDAATFHKAIGVYAGLNTTLPTGFATDSALYADGNSLGNSALFMNGNVGIGTSSPQTNLDINGNIVARGELFFGTNPSNTLNTVPNNTNWHHIGYAGGANYHITGSVQGDMTIGAIPGTGITFGTVVAGQPVPLRRMNISSGGIVTMPYQPAMFAQPNSTNTVQLGTGAKKFGWNTSGGVRFNRGFTLSGSAGSTVFDGNNTGKITVPMDGVYHLYFDMRCEATGGDGQAGIWINGTQYIRRHIQEWATIPYSHCTITATFNLQAGDYIEMGMWWNSTTGGPVSGLSDTVNWMSLTKIA